MLVRARRAHRGTCPARWRRPPSTRSRGTVAERHRHRRRIRRAPDHDDLRIGLRRRRQAAGRQEEARLQPDVRAAGNRLPVLRAHSFADRCAGARADAAEAELAVRVGEVAGRVLALLTPDELRRAAVERVDVAGDVQEAVGDDAVERVAAGRHRRVAALCRDLVQRDRPAQPAELLVDEEVRAVGRQVRAAILDRRRAPPAPARAASCARLGRGFTAATVAGAPRCVGAGARRSFAARRQEEARRDLDQVGDRRPLAARAPGRGLAAGAGAAAAQPEDAGGSGQRAARVLALLAPDEARRLPAPVDVAGHVDRALRVERRRG